MMPKANTRAMQTHLDEISRAVARRAAAAVRVRCAILRAQVRLDLDDQPRQPPTAHNADQPLAQQAACHGRRVGVELHEPLGEIGRAHV